MIFSVTSVVEMLILSFFPVILVGSIAAVLGGHSPHGEEALASLAAEYGPFSDNIIEDAKLDVMGLLDKYGYAAEDHEVETDDGYLVTMHRIAGKKGETVSNNKPVVFLMHGMLSSSADWINMGPHNDALGYVLANEGYDVWMGNARGNYYSRKHASLDPNSTTFWKFSWHEIGFYDVAAMIDYALAVTRQEKLHYIGHSQGSTAFFVLMSQKPEYNKKIKLMQALGPAAYMSNAKNPLLRAIAPYTNTLHIALKVLGINEVGSNRKFYETAGIKICQDGSILQPLCTNILFLFGGFNKELFNTTLLPVITGHTPAGAGTRQLIHYGQGYNSGKFRRFDYGSIVNLVKYLQKTPPEYKLNLITAPVSIYYGDNDILVDPVDVEQLYSELGNPVELYRVPHPRFTHLDFLWAIGVKSLLYDSIINLMSQYH